MSSYTRYTGRSVGRIMRFLYEYSPQSELWVFDGNSIYQDASEKVVICSDVRWFDSFWFNGVELKDVPFFIFEKGFQYLNEMQSHKFSHILTVEAMRMRMKMEREGYNHAT